MYLFQKDKLFVILLTLACIFSWLALLSYLKEGAIFVFLTITMSINLIVNIEIYRRIQKEIYYINEQPPKYLINEYRQIESLFSIFSLIKINCPLPAMRGYAAAPDFANILISLIKEQKPKLILEAGSGVSTLIAAYCLQSIGEGTVISLDHDEAFADLSAKNLFKHELQDIATVVHASLTEIELNDKKWLWYDTSELFEVLKNESIDLLVVDGPPGNTQDLARYPALPILFDLLSENAVIVVDDANRKDEREILNLWIKEFNCFEIEFLESDSGTAILRRKNI